MHVSPEPALTSPEPGWARLLGHLLWETWARAALLGEAGLADTSLTLPSLGVLDAISTWPGITVAEISRRTPKTQQAISQVVARLEKLGYVERRLRPGRGVGLHVTRAGEKAHREGNAREEILEQHLLDLLGSERHNQLRMLLEQACQLLAAEQQPPQ
jgi:DNA-binding MarR family transcriptional regulator